MQCNTKFTLAGSFGVKFEWQSVSTFLFWGLGVDCVLELGLWVQFYFKCPFF